MDHVVRPKLPNRVSATNLIDARWMSLRGSSVSGDNQRMTDIPKEGQEAPLANMSIEEEEARAAEILRPQIVDHLNHAAATCNLIYKLNVSFDGLVFESMPESLRVRLVLSARIADDLRAIQHLSSMGYCEQSCTVAASVFEVAHTAAFIGADDELAIEWIEFDDLKQNFRPVKFLVRATAARLNPDDVDGATKREYDIYRQLCWMKHTNPFFQGLRDPHFWNAHGALRFAPDTTEMGIRCSWFALEHASRLGVFAVETFLRNIDGTDSPHRDQVEQMILAAKRQNYDLQKIAAEHWGTERPFKGKW